MELKEFITLLNRKKQTVISIVLLLLLITTVLTFIQPLRYEAKSRVLLLQYNGEATDPYNAAKSGQFISNLLAQVVTSNAFLNDVFESGYNIDKSYFGESNGEKLAQWNQTAFANVVGDTGIIEVKTFHTDKDQAEQINSAIINTIKTKSSAYYGRSQDISIKVIDEPIVSGLPVQPNIKNNYLLAIIIALIISFSYIYLFPGGEYDIRIIPKKKNKTVEVVVEEKKKIDFNKRMATEVIKMQSEVRPEVKIENKIEIAPKVNNFAERGNMDNIFKHDN